jgi:hypothetical protein
MDIFKNVQNENPGVRIFKKVGCDWHAVKPDISGRPALHNFVSIKFIAKSVSILETGWKHRQLTA